MRKNGTLTIREQTEALAKIDAEIATIVATIEMFAARLLANVNDPIASAWDALHDAETALWAERRRVVLNVPASAVERIMANVD